MVDEGKIYLYKIEWSNTANLKKDECIRSVKDHLQNVIGLFFYHEDYVYSSVRTEDTWNL